MNNQILILMKKIILTTIVMFLLGTGYTQVSITVNATSGKETINRHIYGHFAEHLGRCIYDGFYVGENNKLIPNKEGIRLDIIED